MYLDGQYSQGIKYLLENYVNKYKLPSISNLEGKTFVTNDYDGYITSYLMVSYLIEVYGKKKFLNIIKSQEKIQLISYDLIEKLVL